MIFMNQLEKNEHYDNQTFEDIKHIDENGIEYWYARELMLVLQYAKWENFKKVIEKAIIACKNSEISVKDCFLDVRKPIISGKGKEEFIEDYKLTRYACYLIAQNGDTRKKVIALAQTYFAIQTRKQEISEKDYNLLTEDEKRFYQRNLTKKGIIRLIKLLKMQVLKISTDFIILDIKACIMEKQLTTLQNEKD